MYQKEVKTVVDDLDSSVNGLSSKEAQSRQQKYGFNLLEAKENVNPLKIFLSQFSSPLIGMLLFALAVSLFLKGFVDAIIIGLILAMNSILGFVQEYKAEKALEALKKLSSLKAKVLRDNRIQKMESKDLVPGDIIFLETGNKIPADARMIHRSNFEVMESNLTGESLPASKITDKLPENTLLADRKNMVYSTTIVTMGQAVALVTATGMETEVGKIARLITEEKEELTPLQLKLKILERYLIFMVIIIAIIVFISGISAGREWSAMFLVAIALAVAAIPEGLLAVITIALSLGVKRMIKKNVLVRKLPAVETLGSVDVICVDKTGTLTYNQMTVEKAWANEQVYDLSGSGYDAEGEIRQDRRKINPDELNLLLKIGSLCNDAKLEGAKGKREVMGDPTEGALLVSAMKNKLDSGKMLTKEPRIDEIPFTSERKMMSTLHQSEHNIISYSKGATDVILKSCNRINVNGNISILTKEKKKEIMKQNEDFAKKSLRVLGFAYKENTTKQEAEKDMIFVGMQAMADPPRKEVKESVKRCHDAGIRVIMITGDHPETAVAVAKEIGIKGKVITGAELNSINLKKEINHIGVFARVNPADKLKIIKALKSSNHVVAMTGDGVNDAPALKKADIGVAMGISGTDVAKEASDMILMDDNFTSIVNAIEEGRGIFDNIRKFINYLLSSNLGEVVLIFLASLFGLPLPLSAIQILWINLVTDGLPATALSADSYSPEIMKKRPRDKKENIISKKQATEIVVIGLLIALIGLGLFSTYRIFDPSKAQTMVFTSLVVFELIRIQIIRSSYRLSFFSNKYLLWALGASFLLQLITIYTPFNRWFKTVPLNLFDVVVIAASGLLLLVIYRLVNHFLLRKKISPES